MTKQHPTLAERLRLFEQTVRHDLELFARGRQATRSNPANHKFHASKKGERMTEREFVRAFGDKVKKVRYSNEPDFVGLTVLGIYQGFIVTSDSKGMRKLRLIDIDEQGRAHVTRRFILLRDADSLSALQRGLLKWVR